MLLLPRLSRQALSIRIKLGLSALLFPVLAWSSTQNFDIPAGRLDQVLSQLAIEADIEFTLNASLSQDIYSPGIEGQFDAAEALMLILENTGLIAEPQEDGSYILTPLNSAMTLDAIQVRTHFDDEIARDETGELDIYDADTSTAYINKEEIERFKGASGADLFTGMANTFSGEARNGGSSIDANIRGVQGTGRVPVVIDGTEQGITIWNGYRGASNRNYIDPNLISGLKVHKGAQLNSDVNTSVGGAVQVTTLQPQDIIAEGETFGMEVIVEGSNNSVAPYEAKMHTGKHWREVPIYNEQGGIDWYNDPELRFETRDSKSNNPFGGEDAAFRFAASGINDKFEWLGAIAYRKRGNYYSGTKKADFYKQPYNPDTLNINFLQPRHAALNHLPGHEVFNTSSEMHSYLLKTTYKFSDFEKVQFNARFTESKHGEIMASRSDYRNSDGMAQWPLGSAKLQAYSVKYRVNPESRFLNLSTDLWTTLSDTVTNTAGGFPNTVVTEPEGNGIIFNTATAYNKERRIGANFKNTMLLSDNWDMTVSGHYQHHTVEPKQGMKYLVDKYNATVRAGERTEFNGAAKVEWRASDSLIFNAGLRYGKYESEDHYLKYRIESKSDKRKLGEYITEGYLLTYQTREVYEPEEIAQRVANTEHDVRITFTRDALDKEVATMTSLIASATDPTQKAEYQSRLAAAQSSLANFDSLLQQKIKVAVAKVESEKTYLRTHTQEWRNDSNNKLSMKRNACVIAMSRPNYVKNSCKFTRLPDIQRYKSKYANSGSGWMPSLTATWLISDNNRAYARYAETLRFPSLFESTSGFSAGHLTSSPLQPERATLWELGYVHYFDNANIKLVHFDQTITNIIDRDIRTRAFGNLDFQNTRGLELQASYDDETYFGELSAAYNYHNEICDDNSASQRFIIGVVEENKEIIDLCARGGFSNISYLGSYANPEYSANLLVGSRFLNQTLETGVRGNYVSGSHHEDLIARTHSLTFDAFINYQINESVDLELVGTNLLDLYYLELGSISGIPAPGRTFSVKLKGKF
ncbi:TonB-dependent receptor [Vibrio nigripulchritudo ATCC 27043]|uniref:TonB-dependent receptor n=1 Tax=Vibrio nigripulchritudo TaxID=28173 RepID=UPI00021C3AE6|nr:TonB-dependent receptor [Vibrio nigripulchritudo]EGU60795.1 TonB-dependent receptor [Vibrio nigripulchritudo ATCC 27043]